MPRLYFCSIVLSHIITKTSFTIKSKLHWNWPSSPSSMNGIHYVFRFFTGSDVGNKKYYIESCRIIEVLFFGVSSEFTRNKHTFLIHLLCQEIKTFFEKMTSSYFLDMVLYTSIGNGEHMQQGQNAEYSEWRTIWHEQGGYEWSTVGEISPNENKYEWKFYWIELKGCFYQQSISIKN